MGSDVEFNNKGPTWAGVVALLTGGLQFLWVFFDVNTQVQLNADNIHQMTNRHEVEILRIERDLDENTRLLVEEVRALELRMRELHESSIENDKEIAKKLDLMMAELYKLLGKNDE